MMQRETITTPSGSLTIAQAQPADLDALVAIDTSASRWAAAIGYDPGQPPRPLRDILGERVARGEVYVARLDGAPAAMLTLQWADPDVWGDLQGEAGYVHGLATHRAFAGQGIGLALLRWIEGQVAAAGRSLVRLDCNASDRPLRAYYERAGYTHRGDVALAYRTASRYEKPVMTGE
jgi:ribosomal protein S18 acetylase RimI-like enzyme